jgi:outer membrane immunogenic protein
MKRNIIRALTVSALLIAAPLSAASAADMPLKAPPAPPAPVWNWTGFYLGGNVGWVGEHASGTSNFIDTAFAPTSNTFNNPQANAFNKSGAISGFQAGYNWQTAPSFVIGIEGDFDWMRTSYNFCRQTTIFSIACLDALPNDDGFESISSQTNWIATARARAGVTWEKFLFYATGGAAWGNIKTTESLSCLADGCGSSSSLKLAASTSFQQTQSGWTAGLGVEGMLSPNWSVKAEWLYVDLGTLTNTFSTLGSTGGTESVVWSRSEHYNIVRVGLNYRFNGSLITSK